MWLAIMDVNDADKGEVLNPDTGYRIVPKLSNVNGENKRTLRLLDPRGDTVCEFEGNLQTVINTLDAKPIPKSP